MIIYPAIDLRQGKVVRLRQGDPNAQTIFSDDPVTTAQHWVTQGAPWLHIVNLDGAFGAAQLLASGTAPIADMPLPVNLRCLHMIRQAVDVPIQFGGGLRTIESIQLVFELGVNRVVLGTIAVENPALVSEAVKLWGAERIVVGLDARDGKVVTHGWQTVSAIDAIEMGHRMYALGVRAVLFTDISRDGMMTGVNAKSTAHLGDSTGLKVIASGGVSGIDDIERLKELESYNIEGVVIGQALYTGALDLAQAIQLSGKALRRHSAGLVPYRHLGSEIEILLLYNCILEQWQLPRGQVERGESEADCARRELAEQVGFQVDTIHTDFHQNLAFTRKIREYHVYRTVVYFLAEVSGDYPIYNNENICGAEWYSPQQATELLSETAPELVPVLEAALHHLRNVVRSA